MKKLDKYVFLNIPNGTYLLHTQQPFVVGRVWFYRDIQGLNQQLEKLKPMESIKIHGYNIAVTVWTFLDNKLIYHSNYLEELQQALKGMAAFYEETIIKPKPEKFKKFLT